ncbi:glucose-fructose oxidoreductase domain-containing protein 2 [Hyalella azteca]|uniref:Glucose-fructose oxidoreductase domain-containing protein 2 n=1 Tax=Hyalella azteca TaxID=294128 RepID=A0A8B7NAF8_HYAAZ|nr:glucose-fructose oxidoreductase domain-containing protein 2 [Hyalella azteca]
MSHELPGVGVFGTGGNVGLLVQSLRSHGFTVAAIWSPTLDAALETEAALDVPFATNKVDEVLLHRNVGLVAVLCQPDLHSQIAVKALGIGKHVLCDVPVALNQGQVMKMVHAALYYPSLISVLGHGLRYVPAFQELKRQIKAGYVGELAVCDVNIHYSIAHSNISSSSNYTSTNDNSNYTSNSEQGYDWWCSKLMGGGVLSCIGSHVVDILAFITGETATRAHGVTRTCTRTTRHVRGIRRIDSDHFCCFQLQLTGGAVVNVSLNSHVPGPYNQQLVVCGSKGRLTVRGAALYGQLQEDTHEKLLVEAQGDGAQQAGLPGLVQALKEAFSSGRDGSERPVVGAATFLDGQYVQAVLDAVRLSTATRQWEQVTVMQEDSDSGMRR